MRYWIINWALSTLSLYIASVIVAGIQLRGIGSALIASLAIGLLNATLGAILKLVGFPLTLISLGLFLLVVNALMFLLASKLVSGFHVRNFGAAFLGALVMSITGVVLRYLML